IPSSIVVCTFFGMYGKHWRFAGQRDVLRVLEAVLVATLVLMGAIAVLHPTTVESITGRVGVNLSSGLAALFFLLTSALVGGARFAARMVAERPLRGFRPAKDARRMLIVGAGDGGQLVLREILRNPSLRLNPV